jgi:hypothetical protein
MTASLADGRYAARESLFTASARRVTPVTDDAPREVRERPRGLLSLGQRSPVSDDEAPKSAVELAMARLRQKDKDAGVSERAVSEEQRAKIAEIRKFYVAKLAEREILHKSALLKTGGEPEAVQALEDEYRRDRERLQSERERKIDEARTS